MTKNFKNKKIIAIIPARGGSKSLPRKNIKILAGKPLIAWTIKQALKCKCLDRIIVSTENGEIVKIAKKYNTEVFKRPKYLATDGAELTDVVFHILGTLRKENYKPDIIILLQPTSPLRATNDINNALKLFLRNKCESIISVCNLQHSHFWSFKIKNKYLKPFLGWKYLKERRQKLLEIYIPNGAIFITTPKALNKYKSFYSNKILPYIMPLERSIDIDNKIDFKIAELLIKMVEIKI